MADISAIGGMDTLVEIQAGAAAKGSQGQKSFVFTHHSDVYARVDRNTEEAVSNGNLEEGHTLRLTVYKIPALTTRWRVLVDGKPYEIVSVDPVSRISPVCILTVNAIDG